MRYIPNTEEQKREMLKEIGVNSFEDLIKCIPEKVRLKGELNLPRPLTEAELKEKVYRIAKKNQDFFLMKPLIGAGAYRHWVPEAEKSLLGREEFYSSYTPYQPEMSQGTLQAIFEYQTALARLTKMDVVIPSIYDGASATAEAALMSLRLTHKNKIIISSLVHPHYKETIKTYIAPHRTEIIELPYENGLTGIDSLKGLIKEDIASVIIQSPNFLGGIENIKAISNIVHSHDILLIHTISEALSLGILKAPGELGVDIVSGEAQSFGMQLNFGGPYNGWLGTKREFLRQLPGRIVGETRDRDGKRAFVMTMRVREQDIRRERATSNICTNHNLCCIASDIYLSLLGTEGFYKVSVLNTKAAHYLRDLLLKSKRFEKVFDYPFYNEFLLKSKEDTSIINKKLLENGFIPPLEPSKFYKELENCLLFAVTEIFNREELDRIASVLSR